MLCSTCSKASRSTRRWGGRPPAAAPRHPLLDARFCSSCAAILPPVERPQDYLAKLMQLDRLGIGSGRAGLLEARRTPGPRWPEQGLARWCVIGLFAAVAAAATPAPGPAAAQEVPGLQMNREGLMQLLENFEATERSTAYSDALRASARYEAELIRSRLEEGDFQVGDRITLRVEGEPELTGEFPVETSRVLVLPLVGSIPLQGVLRSEVNEHLANHLRRFIRDPVVQARSLIRISVLGSVGQPGYYLIPAEALVTDALMQAGGPAGDADLAGTRIMRGQAEVWNGEALREAMVAGRTLDQMNLRAGDEIVVPRTRARQVGSVVQLAITVVTTVVLLATTLGQSP